MLQSMSHNKSTPQRHATRQRARNTDVSVDLPTARPAHRTAAIWKPRQASCLQLWMRYMRCGCRHSTPRPAPWMISLPCPPLAAAQHCFAQVHAAPPERSAHACAAHGRL